MKKFKINNQNYQKKFRIKINKNKVNKMKFLNI